MGTAAQAIEDKESNDICVPSIIDDCLGGVDKQHNTTLIEGTFRLWRVRRLPGLMNAKSMFGLGTNVLNAVKQSKYYSLIEIIGEGSASMTSVIHDKQQHNVSQIIGNKSDPLRPFGSNARQTLKHFLISFNFEFVRKLT